MKRTACALLVLALVLSILPGCSGSTQRVSCGELQLEIPRDYKRMQNVSGSLDLAYTNEKQSVLAVSELRSAVADYDPKISSAIAYAYTFIATNELACEPVEQDDYAIFTYTASAKGVTITYLCGVYMGIDRFWVVQTYCRDTDFAASEDTFRQILISVSVD